MLRVLSLLLTTADVVAVAGSLAAVVSAAAVVAEEVLRHNAVERVCKVVDTGLPGLQHVLQGPDVADGHVENINLAQLLTLALAEGGMGHPLTQQLEPLVNLPLPLTFPGVRLTPAVTGHARREWLRLRTPPFTLPPPKLRFCLFAINPFDIHHNALEMSSPRANQVTTDTLPLPAHSDDVS